MPDRTPSDATADRTAADDPRRADDPTLAAEARRAADAAARPSGLALVVAGVAHLLVPGLLLRTARAGYRTVLGVRFRPGERSARRVRLLGLAMIAAGAHLLYHGGIRP